MIERNKHAAGRISNIVFGVACILDGLVRAVSFGFLHTRLPVEVSRIQAKRIHLRQMRKTLKAAGRIERATKGLQK